MSGEIKDLQARVSTVVDRTELGAARRPSFVERAGWSGRELAAAVEEATPPHPDKPGVKRFGPVGYVTILNWCKGERLPNPVHLPVFVLMLKVLGVEDVAPWVDALRRARTGRVAGEPPYPGLRKLRPRRGSLVPRS